MIKTVKHWSASLRHTPLNPNAIVVTAIYALLLTIVVWRLTGDCLTLVVASSNEKSELLAGLAGKFHASVDRRCVRVKVNQMASGTAEKALGRDWKDLPPEDRPNVWTPAATTWLLLLRYDRDLNKMPDILPAVSQPLMQSPLVIAMPKSMADTLLRSADRIGWHDLDSLVRDPAGWARFGKPWGPFRLAQTTPLISTSGLHAMISLNNTAQVEADPTTFVKDIDSSVVHYADTVKSFLVALYQADQRNEATSYVSAIAVEEKQVFDYNRGNPESKPCAAIHNCFMPDPNEKLVALYPKEGTLYADHPYAILNWPNQKDSDLYEQAAVAFERYLESADVQDSLKSEGFRDSLRQAGDRLTTPYFQKSEPKSLYSPPLPEVIRQTVNSWTTEIRKPANAVLLLNADKPTGSDVSGGRTKLRAVQDAIANTLEELGRNDTIGLRTFPTQTGEAYREVLPPTKLDGPPSQLAQRVGALQPEPGKRSLYSSIRAAAEQIQATYARASVNAVVVITFGGNQTVDRKEDLIAWLEQQRVLLFVVDLSSDGRDELKEIVDAAGGLFYDASDPSSIEDSIRKALLNL